MINDSNDPTINDTNDGWSFTNIRASIPDFRLPLEAPCVNLKPLFRVPTSASKFDLSSKPWNPFNKAQNPPKTLPKTLPKRLQNSILSSNARNPQKMQPSHTKTSFLTFPGLQKSSQNRCQNAFKISFVFDTRLEPQRIWFLMLKRRQDGSPKFPIFCQKRLKILARTVFGPRCLLKASKSLPRASQEPPKIRPRALKRLSTAFKSLPWGPQEDSKSLLCRPFYLFSQNSKQGSRGAARPRAAQESKLSRVFWRGVRRAGQ